MYNTADHVPPNEAEGEEFFAILDLARAVKKRLWLVAVVAFLCVGAAVAASLLSPPAYEATGLQPPGTSCRFSCVEQRGSRKNRRSILERLRVCDEAIGAAYELSQRFVEMLRDLDGERLEEWLAQAESCEAPALRRFSASLKTDLSAVRAGLTESWNNGPVEGFLHKLKLVKRQGYGRANIDLLKAWVMAA